jgi:hypothetical protein
VRVVDWLLLLKNSFCFLHQSSCSPLRDRYIHREKSERESDRFASYTTHYMTVRSSIIVLPLIN